MKAAILGAGAWGTALAKVLAEKGDDVAMWARHVSLCETVNATGENTRYLPGVKLPRTVSCTHNLAGALDGAETVVFVVPSHATRDVARAAAPYMQRSRPLAGGGDATLVIGATKGIENDSLMFMDEILFDELPASARESLAFVSGPSFARELAEHTPTAVVVASSHAGVRQEAARRLHTAYLRTYTSDDVIGVECGGALKNVIAIASGAIEAMGFGHNTRAALITRGIAEVARLATARGGSALTLAGLAGVGDLVLTCTGDLSRNRTVGRELGRGRPLAEVLATLGHVAEGVTTAKSAYELSKKLAVDMPITGEVYSVLYEGKPVRQAVKDLMARELGYEFDLRAVARARS
ncbi:MAG TPA: NAD(P)H-dependent glycerol-3-phosphate dehydrogenase [Polyangiaceae bacterium]|nr:NAD(P)H-dependent glycerol-3-phosphate dehydrogenase [Polyangiaceae bacterium]